MIDTPESMLWNLDEARAPYIEHVLLDRLDINNRASNDHKQATVPCKAWDAHWDIKLHMLPKRIWHEVGPCKISGNWYTWFTLPWESEDCWHEMGIDSIDVIAWIWDGLASDKLMQKCEVYICIWAPKPEHGRQYWCTCIEFGICHDGRILWADSAVVKVFTASYKTETA